MHPLRPIGHALLCLSAIHLAASLGINYRGSSQCSPGINTINGDIKNLLPSFYYVLVSGGQGDTLPGGPVDPASIYYSGQHIVCAQNDAYGSICLFMQGNVPKEGVNASVIIAKLKELVVHGCQWCGSVPLGGNNDPKLMGQLTSNYVHTGGCDGLCLQDDLPNVTYTGKTTTVTEEGTSTSAVPMQSGQP